MRIEDVIGYWITRGREESGMTQAQMGEALGEHLDKPWPKQAVSAAEKGRRAFTAAELVAFALVLKATVESLLEPPPGVDVVDLGNGPALDARRLRTAAATNSDLADLAQAVFAMRRKWGLLQLTVDELTELQDGVVREIHRAVRGRGLSSTPRLNGKPRRSSASSSGTPTERNGFDSWGEIRGRPTGVGPAGSSTGCGSC